MRLVSSLLALCVASLAFSGSAKPQAPEAWRSDWDAYIDAVNECLQAPGCEGSSKFGEQKVTWTGVFEGVGSIPPDTGIFEAGKFLTGQKPHVALRMKTRQVYFSFNYRRMELGTVDILYLTIPEADLEKWKKLEVGKETVFRVTLGKYVGGIGRYATRIVRSFGDCELVSQPTIDPHPALRRSAD